MSQLSPSVDASRVWGRRAWGAAVSATGTIPILGAAVSERPWVLSLTMTAGLLSSGAAIWWGARWLGKLLLLLAVILLLVWTFIGHMPPTYQVAGAVLVLVAFGGGLLTLTGRSRRG